MENNNDEWLLNAIRKGGTERQRAIQRIYSDRQFCAQIIRFVQSNRGNEQDGEDVFHEGIIVLDRNIREDKFRGESSLKGYLYSICKFLWMNQMRKKSKISLTDDTLKMDRAANETIESGYFDEERKMLLTKVLESLGDRCKRILELWKLSYSMEEIAQELGFSSEAMARKNKYKCHKSLVELIKNNPALQTYLKNR
jgi:RNA polymerase sigma factor (sigma-70 family)